MKNKPHTYSCQDCGANMEGDGFTIVHACENVDVIYTNYEPDCGPIYCGFSDKPSQIVKAFKNAFKLKSKRNFDVIYVVIDLHGTIITPEYNKFNTGAKIYPYAESVLSYLTKRKDIILILWTSSYEEPIKKIIKMAAQKGVIFDFFNENPLEKSNDLCCFDKKPYFNVLLDDKAGFDPETDWLALKKYFKI